MTLCLVKCRPALLRFLTLDSATQSQTPRIHLILCSESVLLRQCQSYLTALEFFLTARKVRKDCWFVWSECPPNQNGSTNYDKDMVMRYWQVKTALKYRSITHSVLCIPVYPHFIGKSKNICILYSDMTNSSLKPMWLYKHHSKKLDIASKNWTSAF